MTEALIEQLQLLLSDKSDRYISKASFATT